MIAIGIWTLEDNKGYAYEKEILISLVTKEQTLLFYYVVY